MQEIRLRGTAEKRPWIARLTGVERTEDGKIRFNRDFKSGVSVYRRFGSTDEYTALIHGDGIYEASEARCRYYLVVCGTRKDFVWNEEIFPTSWRDYMRENGCSYEDIWERAWSTLWNRFEWMRMQTVGSHRAASTNSHDERANDEESNGNIECSL